MKMSNIENTLAQRANTHGEFSENARISQGIKRLCLRHVKEDMTDVQREGLSAIAAKLARILSGGHNHSDNWHDIAGYAVLVEQHINYWESYYDTEPDSGHEAPTAPESEVKRWGEDSEDTQIQD